MALKGVKKYAEELERRRGSGGSGKRLWFRVNDGESEVIRPLEEGDDFTSAFVHSVEFKRENGSKSFRDVVCLDQPGNGTTPCPGCEERARIANPKDDRRFARRYKFYLNVIWREGPTYEKDDEGKFVRGDDGYNEIGRADVVAIWSGGIRAAEELDHADEKFGGLVARDYEVEREGKKLDTKYRVAPPVDDNGDTIKAKTLSAADKKLAEDRYDLDELITKRSYDEFFDSGGGSAKDGPTEDPATKESPFRRKKNAETD